MILILIFILFRYLRFEILLMRKKNSSRGTREKKESLFRFR